MKNILRRSFTLLLCFALCLSLLPAASVYAEEESEVTASAGAEGEPVIESELPTDGELPVESEPITEGELPEEPEAEDSAAENGETELETFTLGETKEVLEEEAQYSFLAPEDGWYSFMGNVGSDTELTLTVIDSSGTVLASFSQDSENVFGRGSCCFYAAAGETYTLSAYCQFWMGGAGFGMNLELQAAVPATGISVGGHAYAATSGQTLVFYMRFEPQNAILEEYTWESSNPAVASVDQEGQVHCLSNGKTTITVSSESGLSASCDVTVTAPTAFQFSCQARTGYVGTTDYIGFDFEPYGAVEHVEVTSSDPSVAELTYNESNDYWNVSYLKIGTATLTATSASGLTDVCTVTVKEMETLTLDETITVTIEPDDVLKYLFVPTETAEYAFYSEDSRLCLSCSEYTNWIYYDTGSDILEMDSGVTYNLKAWNNTSTPLTCTIGVKKTVPVERVEIVRQGEWTPCVGDTLTLYAYTYPAWAQREERSWSVDNEEVATISDSGGSAYIQLNAVGTATVTVTTESGACDSYTIDVEESRDITSFEKLEALCSNPPEEWTSYNCSGTIVIEHDLTIPETVYLNGGCTLVVPEGVTLTNDGGIYCTAAEINGTLVNNSEGTVTCHTAEINGTLVNNGYFGVYTQANITGRVVNNDVMKLPGDSTEGLDKIEEADNSQLTLSFSITDEGRLRTLLQSAAEDAATTHWYDIDIEQAISLSADLAVGENTRLYLHAPVEIPAGITLVNNGWVYIWYDTMTVNGSLVNKKSIDIGSDGLLALGESGTYSGSAYAWIYINKGSISDPFSALPGFDSNSFEQREYEDLWILNWVITSSEELETICSNPPEEWTSYSCSGTIEIEHDLTIPENMYLNGIANGCTLVVPEGVTLINDGTISCIAAEINGTLVNNSTFRVEEQANITGRVVNNYNMNLPGDSAEGLDKIEEADSSYLIFTFSIADEGRLRAVLQSAAEDAATTHWYHIDIEQAISLSADLAVGENTTLDFYASLEIPAGITLVNDGHVWLYNTMTVNGSLVNNGRIYIERNDYLGYEGLLALGETGTYSGYGMISIYKYCFSDPFMALSGFDSYSFEQEEEEYSWTLYLPRDILPGDITGDGDVDTKDAIALMQYLTGESSAVSGSADLNGDGEENTKDVVLLMQYLTGEDIIID